MFSKYTGHEERKIHKKLDLCNIRMRYHRERFLYFESEFFRLNEQIGNKYGKSYKEKVYKVV